MKKTRIKILIIYSLFLNLTNSFADICDCESWKVKTMNAKSEIEDVLGEEVDLNKTFSKISEKLDHNSTKIMPHIKIKGYKLDYFMNYDENLNILDEKFSGNMVYFENKHLTMAGSVFERKYLDKIDSEDMNILSKEMGHHKDYIKAIKNTNEYQLFRGMFTNKFSEINCEKLVNWYSLAYLMNKKSSVSFVNNDWYHIEGENYKLILAYNKSSNQIELHYFTKEDSINLLFIYKDPIVEINFHKWLISINENT